jgi:FkbM family methyltransferase
MRFITINKESALKAESNNTHLYQQNTDLEILALLIPFLAHSSFLDIGAEKGEFTRFFSKHRLKGVFFEPLPKCTDELNELAKETGCIFSSYAIDANDRTADFYHAYDQGDNDAQYFSSLHPLQNDSRIQHKKVSTVQCRSLNSLLKEGVISSPIGIVKIDTEGNDLNVFKGMSQIKAEVIMCEYFMPKIYAGWELGHPVGLLEQARQLGFNHFIAIKRIEDFEFISLDNEFFIDKQWGNLVFISDKIYEKARAVIANYIGQKEVSSISNVVVKASERLAVIENLKKSCDERLTAIEDLTAACAERLIIIENLQQYCRKLEKIMGITAIKSGLKCLKKLKLFSSKI